MKRGLFRGERKMRAVKVARRGPVRLKLSKRGRAALGGRSTARAGSPW